MEMVVSQHIANSIRRQKYDWEDVPDNSMGLVPMDQAKWDGSFVDMGDQRGVVHTEEDALWVGAFDSMEDVQGVVQTEEDAAWSASFIEMQDLQA